MRDCPRWLRTVFVLVILVGVARVMSPPILRKLASIDAEQRRTAREESNAKEIAFAPPLPDQPLDDRPDVFIETLADLELLQSRCIELVPKVQPAVVGVMPPSKSVELTNGSRGIFPGASGVIITEDGLVLSQMHVSHRRAGTKDSTTEHLPGELTTVVLTDGSVRSAKLLGADPNFDLSLLQLQDPGPYPFVPLSREARVRTGDWVVKLGHPLGYRKDRPAPLRLGRVVGSTPEAYVTDCPIVAGDSGGPFFDLDGRLVGIVCRPDTQIDNHFVSSQSDRGVMVDRVNMVISSPRIHSLLESMKDEKIAEGGRVGYVRALSSTDVLPADQWTQAVTTRSFWNPIKSELQSRVFTIVNADVPIALATVVTADGYAVTKATHLPQHPRCRLSDGTTKAVEVVGVNKAFDVAVLRLVDVKSSPVKWINRDECPVGTLTLALGEAGTVHRFGVISVAPRPLQDFRTQHYKLPLRRSPTPPEFSGTKGETEELIVDSAWGLARASGIRPTDHIISIAGKPIASNDDVRISVQEHLSGDVVEVLVSRGESSINLQLPLWPEVKILEQTFRCDDFPIALEYSPPVENTMCGGPLVNLNGEALGVTIGRTAHHAGWAIPAAQILEIVADAKSGKLTGW